MTDTANDQGAEPQALPGDGLREGIVDELRRRLGDAVVDVELRPNDDLWVRVATDAWAATGEALRAMGFTYFCFLSGLDWLPSPYGRGEDNPDEPPAARSTEIVQGVTGGETRFQVFARVIDTARHVGITVKADVADDDPAIASWHAIWAGANWHERETHEMFGISFLGHPDLRHIYLPTDFEGHPLRKDFPLLPRMIKPWPGIVDVEPMPAVEEPDAPEGSETAGAQSSADEAASTEGSADEAAGTEGSADEAAGTQSAPVGEVNSEAGTIVGEQAAAEALATSPEEAPAFESTEQADQRPDGGEDAVIDDTTSAGVASDPEAEPRPAAEGDDAVAAAEAIPDVESTPEESTDVVASAEVADGSWSPDIPVADVEGPYGVGSKGPRPDGSQPPDHPVKASSATMRFHVPGSEGYDDVVADVWFDSQTTARRAGFTSPFDAPSDDRDDSRPGSGEDAS